MQHTLDGWLAFIGEQHTETIDMGLDRMHAMVARLDLDRPAGSVITVAGTNGKGSTTVAIEQILLAHGVSVGATLSPHIVRFNERVRLNGGEASDTELCEAFAAIDSARAGVPLTYFEFGALAALWCFRRAEVAVAVLEIGLGGRLDAFNAIDADVGVVTSIGHDHQEYLGDTLELIGREKAGIFRAGQSVVLGQAMPASVLDACASLGVRPRVSGEDFRFSLNDARPTWRYVDADLELDAPLGALAPHNLALALAACQAVTALDATRCATAMATVKLPGRMQEIALDGRRFVFDVAHNEEGARFLGRELEARGLRPQLIACAMLEGKPHRAVHAAIADAVSAPWVLFGTRGERSLSSRELACSMNTDAICVDDFAAVREHVRSATGPGDVILVFGSFNAVEQGITSAEKQPNG
jgi:dihydrofolate synthase/folylpolyglutamate synthase